MFDVRQDDANALLWEIYRSIERGDLTMKDGATWTPDGEVIGVWRDVHPTQADAADGWFAAGVERRARAGKDGPFRAFQLVVRDGGGRFPWEAGYDERLRYRQPALHLPAEDYGPGPLSSADREALRLADERGWSIRMVDVPGLKWAYTIGLSALGHPELIAILPSADGAANMLHEAQAYLARGDLVLEDGLRWDALGFECCWRRVHESQHAALNVFFLAKLRHEHRTGRREAIETYQLFLPDHDGRYPWDPGCKVRESQPLLFEPFDPTQLERGPLAALMRM